MRAAVIDLLTNIVINIIVANAGVDPAPEGTLLVDVIEIPCDIGWVYDPATGTFTDPNPPATE
jgi:hypothetical protein